MTLHRLAVFLLLATTAFAQDGTRYDAPQSGLVAAVSFPSGPLAVWRDNNGTVKANGHIVATNSARIAAAGVGNFALVVWTEADGDVMAARRNADGTPSGVTRKVGTNATGPVAVAGNVDRYFIAWPGTLGEIYGALVNTIGLPILPAMPITTQSTSNITEIQAAAAAGGFAAVWHDVPALKVYAITVDTNGLPVSMEPLLLAEENALPDITSNGDVFLAIWGAGSIESRTLTVDRKLGIKHYVTDGAAPKIAWDGKAYTLAFARTVYPRPGFAFPQLFVRRITIYGTYVDAFHPPNSLLPGDWDVSAAAGRFDIVHSGGAIVSVDSYIAQEPRSRIRAMRH